MLRATQPLSKKWLELSLAVCTCTWKLDGRVAGWVCLLSGQRQPKPTLSTQCDRPSHTSPKTHLDHHRHPEQAQSRNCLHRTKISNHQTLHGSNPCPSDADKARFKHRDTTQHGRRTAPFERPGLGSNDAASLCQLDISHPRWDMVPPEARLFVAPSRRHHLPQHCARQHPEPPPRNPKS